MKKTIKLLLPVALFSFINLNASEKPADSKVDPESASLQKDIDTLKAQGNLGPVATRARELETQRLTQRYLELGLKTNKTEAEQKEFKDIGAELKTRISGTLSSILPAK